MSSFESPSSNPYEAPQTSVSKLRHWQVVTVIISLWCFSAAIGGFLLGAVVFGVVYRFNIQAFSTILQSDWWQFALFMALFGAAVAFPWGLARTRKLNERLHDIHQRRQSLIQEINSRRRSQ